MFSELPDVDIAIITSFFLPKLSRDLENTYLNPKSFEHAVKYVLSKVNDIAGIDVRLIFGL